jgi:hypothetical protein
MSDTKAADNTDDNNCAEFLCISRVWRRGIEEAANYHSTEANFGHVGIDDRRKAKGKKYTIIVKGEMSIIQGREEIASKLKWTPQTFTTKIQEAKLAGVGSIFRNGIEVMVE